MRDDNQHIDDLFREGLKGLKQNPPPYVYDNIREKLNNQKNRKKLFLIRSIAAAAIIIIAFGSDYLLNQKQVQQQISSEQENVSEERTVPVNKESVIIEPGTSKSDITIAKVSDITGEKDEITKELNPTYFTGRELRSELIHDVPEKVFIKKHSGIIANFIDFTKLPSSTQAQPDLSSAKLNINSISSSLANITLLPKKTNKWSITGQISPSYSSKNSQSGMLNADAMESFSPRDQQENYQEEAILSLSGGMQMSYEINKNWELASGIYYSLNGLVTKDFFSSNSGLYALNSSTLNNSIGSINFTNSPLELIESEIGKNSDDELLSINEPSNLIQHFEYIEIPFLIKRKLIDKKLGMHLLAGLRTGFLVGNNAYYSVSGQSQNIGSTYGIKRISYNGILGFGLNLALSHKLSLNFEPSFKYSLRKVNTGPENYYPWTIDLFSGIVFHF